MPSIQMSRKHAKSMAEARTAVEKVAKSIAKKFSVEHHWDGNTLHFERSGVDGNIALSKGLVTVTVNLSFLLLAIKGPIQDAIDEHLEKEFG